MFGWWEDVGPMFPKRKEGCLDIELPPGCIEQDYTGVSHDALLTMIQHWDGERLKSAILGQIKTHGATNNQRALITEAIDMLLREEREALQMSRFEHVKAGNHAITP